MRKLSADDGSFLLKVLTEEWRVFKDVLSRPEQAFASELRDTRSKRAHVGAFAADDTYRTLDFMEGQLVVAGAGASLPARCALGSDQEEA